MEYLTLIAEIESLKAEIAILKIPKKTKLVRTACPGMTGKGVTCKKYCVQGEEACKVHSRAPKEKVTKVKAPKEPKKVCCGVNMRGNACKKKCVDGETWCEAHDPELPQKEKKTKKKKIAPEHNHSVGVEPLVPCELCQTHGDMFDPNVDNVKWIAESAFWAARTDARMI